VLQNRTELIESVFSLAATLTEIINNLPNEITVPYYEKNGKHICKNLPLFLILTLKQATQPLVKRMKSSFSREFSSFLNYKRTAVSMKSTIIKNPLMTSSKRYKKYPKFLNLID